MSCQQVPTTPAFNPYPRSVQVGEFEVAIGGGIWVAIGECETGVRRLDVIELRIWLKALGYELADFVQALDNSVPLLPDQARNSPAAAQ